jgi:hypothetical protein
MSTVSSGSGSGSGSGRSSKQRPNKGRLVTSAIEGLRLTEVRKLLNEVRKRSREKSATTPFVLGSVIDGQTYGDLTCEQFALKFVMGQHLKRYNHYTKSGRVPSVAPAQTQ